MNTDYITDWSTREAEYGEKIHRFYKYNPPK